jgi:hypothetical protein
MNESTAGRLRSRKPAFGIASMVCFSVATGLGAYALTHCEDFLYYTFSSVGIPPAPGTTVSCAGIPTCLNAGRGALVLWLLGTGFTITGLVRAEWPRWPAIIALPFCASSEAQGAFVRFLGPPSPRLSVAASQNSKQTFHALQGARSVKPIGKCFCRHGIRFGVKSRRLIANRQGAFRVCWFRRDLVRSH